MQQQRRLTLKAAMSLGSFACASPFLGAQTLSKSESQSSGRLVLVFLRGAYDGLSMLVPHGDPHYALIRPNIGIPKPDGTAQTALKLDDLFGLHPSCASLMPLWQQGVLAAIPCAGSPDSSRSHFDAQYHWETGKPGSNSPSAGWMNVLSAMLDKASSSGATHANSLISAIAVGESSPKILTGPHKVQLVGNGNSATRAGSLAESKTRDAVLQLYASDANLANAMLDGSSSRIKTAEMLKAAPTTGMQSEQQAANNGAGAPQGLALDARNLGTLMRQNRNLRLGFLSAGGWDTHINQGAVNGQLANNLQNLSRTLLQLREAFNEPQDVIVVASEFGRTCAENGTRGTDHGHGNVMWLMGNSVNGGKWHGRWEGLAKAQLNEGRDLPVHHDFRAVFSQAFVSALGVTPRQAENIFQGFAWDSSLNNLFKS
jgi:uncharacterized protein (DUF1501 family)